MGKRICGITGLLILMIFGCSVSALAAGKEEPPVSMEVSSVYGAIGKMGVPVPLKVKLYGQAEEPFSGTVSVFAMEQGEETDSRMYEYRYPAAVSMGETKKLDLYVPLGQGSNELHVELKDEDGEIFDTETVLFDVSKDRGRLLVGVLSDQQEELQYLDGVSMEYGLARSKLLFLDEHNLPSESMGLELLDILMVNQFQMDELSDAQKKAVKEWVREGGTLVLGTGESYADTLGEFVKDLTEVELEGIAMENIDFGAEYAEYAPGDSTLDMRIARFQIPEGMETEESDGIPLLTMLSYGDGQIGMYAFDLGNLKEFVQKHPSYVQQMFTNLLGQDAIANLYSYSTYGQESEYWNAQSLVNNGQTERLPNLRLYAAVIGVYVLLAGPGLYLFLRKKEMSRSYGPAVAICSVLFSMVVYILGEDTRFQSQFFTTASVVEMDGTAVRETSYVNIQTPDSRPFAVRFPSEYRVLPLTRTDNYQNQSRGKESWKGPSDVTVWYDEAGTKLSSGMSRAFEPSFFKLSRETTQKNGTIYGQLEWFDGKLSGILTNGFPFRLENAALMLFGQMYVLGDLEPGESRELKEEPLLIWPVGMPYLASGQITGEQAAQNSLYTYQLEQVFDTCHMGARLLGFGPEGGVAKEESFAEEYVDGYTLYCVDVPVTAGRGERVYRSGVLRQPEVKSGNGSVYNNSFMMYGTEAVTVEYFPGTNLEIEKLSFMPISDVFFEEGVSSYLKKFDGKASFYNHATGMYDAVDLTKKHFHADELAPYLSPANSILVTYAAGADDAAGVSSLLPQLMVTGRKN